mmetsp:Transcript_10144/g.22841  ORF Transcript_10144/g.22841 Transcript_10144/m.22841 type:complete len:225 (+) Transcript_10144:86-760(+)
MTVEPPWLPLDRDPSPMFPLPATGDNLGSEKARKRQGQPVLSSGGILPSRGSSMCAMDDSVAALLPKMKRMRLRPSLGQLRLQREADDVCDLPPEVQILLEPEQLRATVTIAAVSSKCSAALPGLSASEPAMHLEVSFPPQYPHKPPKVMQVAPEGFLPYWRYEAGRVVALARLTECTWSCSMGVVDIIKDLMQAVNEVQETTACHLGPGIGTAAQFVADVDMD